MLEDGQEDPACGCATGTRTDQEGQSRPPLRRALGFDSAGPDELDALPGHAAVYNTFNVQWHLIEVVDASQFSSDCCLNRLMRA